MNLNTIKGDETNKPREEVFVSLYNKLFWENNLDHSIMHFWAFKSVWNWQDEEEAKDWLIKFTQKYKKARVNWHKFDISKDCLAEISLIEGGDPS